MSGRDVFKGHECAYDFCDQCADLRDAGWDEADRLEKALRSIADNGPAEHNCNGRCSRCLASFALAAPVENRGK